MALISIVIVLIVIGVLLWLVNGYVPMQPPFKQIVNTVVIVAAVIWLLAILLGQARIPILFP